MMQCRSLQTSEPVEWAGVQLANRYSVCFWGRTEAQAGGVQTIRRVSTGQKCGALGAESPQPPCNRAPSEVSCPLPRLMPQAAA